MTKRDFSAYISNSHKNTSPSCEKLRRTIVQLRYILQEAVVAYDSSQLLNSVSNAKTLLHYFDKQQVSVKPTGFIKTTFSCIDDNKDREAGD